MGLKRRNTGRSGERQLSKMKLPRIQSEQMSMIGKILKADGKKVS